MDFIIIILLSGVITFLLIIGRIRSKTSYKRRRNLLALINQNQFEYQLLDLRKEKDFLKGSIPTSDNRTLIELEKTLPTEKMFETIIVYGYTWRHSNRAARYLSDTGYFNVTSFGPARRWGRKMYKPEKEGEKMENLQKGESLEQNQ